MGDAMTEQERTERFVEALRALEQQYGIMLRPALRLETMNYGAEGLPMVQARVEMIPMAMPGWAPGPDSGKGK